MRDRLPPASWGYPLAILATAAAVAVRWLLDPWLGDLLALVTLYAAVAVTVWFGGYRPAILAVVLGYLACDYLFIEPRGRITMPTVANLVGLLAYLVSCAIIIGFAEAMHAAQARLRRSQRELADFFENASVSEQRLRLALEAGRMGTWEWSLETGQVIWSPGLEAIHGLKPGTFDGTFEAYQRDIHPEDRETVRKAIEHALRTGDDHHVEYRILWADGSVHWVEGRGKVFRNDAGAPVRMMGVCADVTERKLAEQQLRESEDRLQAADRRKDEFLATLAHELRNPLAPVRNSLEIMKRAGADAGLVAQARDTMDRQLAQMERLIEDLLDISRITRNKLELRREHLELASVVHHALEACRPLAEESRHEVTVSLPPEPIYLNGDPVRLAQVLGNLLNNACKYTEPGGRIALTAQRQEGQVVVSVRDNGIGIAAEMLPRIFEMFTQVDRASERSHSGLGIGLSLVKRLVEMHGGTVEAMSEGPGRGSQFVVRLPILAGKPHDQPAPTVDGQTATVPRRILVVDDNQESAQSLAMLLKLTGHETLVAYDGLGAVEAAQSFRPDLVLLDLGLPKLSGFDACRQIRDQAWGKDTVMVALTGWGQEEDRRRSRDAGFDDHLVKPVDHAVLMRLLSRLPT